MQALSQCQAIDRQSPNTQEPKTTIGVLSSSDTPVLNPKVLQDLQKMAGDDASEFVLEMIDCYCNHTPKQLQAMRVALVQGDAATLQRAAHGLKASSASVGATSLSKLCRELEHLADAQIPAEAETYLAKIEIESARVEAALAMERQLYQC